MWNECSKFLFGFTIASRSAIPRYFSIFQCRFSVFVVKKDVSRCVVVREVDNFFFCGWIWCFIRSTFPNSFSFGRSWDGTTGRRRWWSSLHDEWASGGFKDELKLG